MAGAREFGMGSQLGVGLPEEKPGRVPSEDWKRQATGEPWYPGFTLNSVIGQGDILATPLQMLQLVTAFAMDGQFTTAPDQPHQRRAVQPERKSLTAGTGTSSAKAWSDDHRSRLQPYLAPGRLQRQHRRQDRTAENGRSGARTLLVHGLRPLMTRKVAIVVFIENGGFSSSVAVPVASNFLKLYYNVDGIADASR